MLISSAGDTVALAGHLTRAQITYAATDAWVCWELYLKFAGAGLLR